MEFMLQCRKFCPEIRMSRVANSGETGKLACPGRPCSTSTPAKRITTPVVRTGITGQAGLQNVEGKARRHRQHASTARSCNAAIGIFSGSRLRPAVVRAKRACKMSRARRGDTDSTPIRQGAATPPSAFSQVRASGPLLFGPSGPEKCRGQGAATQTARQYGKELQRRHRHFLGPASVARCC